MVRRVIGISLGSSKRDETINVHLLGQEFLIQRIGTDGNYQRACELIRQYDGIVDALCLGGIDSRLEVEGKSYFIQDGLRLANCAHKTPVVDGSCLKGTLEPYIVQQIAVQGVLNLKGMKTFMVSALDRYGMVEELIKQGALVRMGDMLALNLDITFQTTKTLAHFAQILLPIVTRLPFQWFYPTGSKQEVVKPHRLGQKYCQEADLIVGDWHYIKKYLPASALGKFVLTNTLRPKDFEFLKNAGVKMVITTTPLHNGVSFGTNLWEGVIVCLLGKRPDEITRDDYLGIIKELGWQLQVTEF